MATPTEDIIRLLERFEGHKREHELLISSLNYRLESMNDLRDQIYSERGQYVANTTFEERVSALHRVVDTVQLDVARYIARADQATLSSAVEREGLNTRLNSMNEFRSATVNQNSLFVTRVESDLKFNGANSVVKEIADRCDGRLTRIESTMVTRSEIAGMHEHMDSRVKILETKSANLDGRMWGFGALFTMFNLVLTWWLAHGSLNL